MGFLIMMNFYKRFFGQLNKARIEVIEIVGEGGGLIMIMGTLMLLRNGRRFLNKLNNNNNNNQEGVGIIDKAGIEIRLKILGVEVMEGLGGCRIVEG